MKSNKSNIIKKGKQELVKNTAVIKQRSSLFSRFSMNLHLDQQLIGFNYFILQSH